MLEKQFFMEKIFRFYENDCVPSFLEGLNILNLIKKLLLQFINGYSKGVVF